jgi:hypothetical protein
MATLDSKLATKFYALLFRTRNSENGATRSARLRQLEEPFTTIRLLQAADPTNGFHYGPGSSARGTGVGRALRLGRRAKTGGVDMLSPAVAAMISRLEDFLPAIDPLDPPPFPPSVSLVSAEEKQVGLGQWRHLDEENHFPVAHKGIRVAATTRFQLWDQGPDSVEESANTLTQDVLAEREQLRTDGFLELKLKNVSVADAPAAGSWRQIVEFEVVFEFRTTDSDEAGGLIARIPAELRPALGSLLITGDLAVWHEDAAAALEVTGGRGAITGLSSLEFLPGGVPVDSVRITRTFDGAAGAPDPAASFAAFLTAVAGPNPASRHSSFEFASFSAFQTALGSAGDPVEFVNEAGDPQAYTSRSLDFAQPVELSSLSDRFELTFGGAALGAGQVFYIRVLRGETNPA